MFRAVVIGAFYLACVRVVYDSYDKAMKHGKKCPCYSRLAPKAATNTTQSLDEIMEKFTTRAKVIKKKDAIVAGEEGKDAQYEEYSEVSAVADLIFSTSFGLKCFEDSNCTAAVFYMFRGVLLVAAAAASRFLPLINFVVVALMIIDYDATSNRLDISIQYFIGLLFLVTSAFVMNIGAFVRNVGEIVPPLNIGGLFAPPAVALEVHPVDAMPVVRQKNGRFASARAITN